PVLPALRKPRSPRGARVRGGERSGAWRNRAGPVEHSAQVRRVTGRPKRGRAARFATHGTRSRDYLVGVRAPVTHTRQRVEGACATLIHTGPSGRLGFRLGASGARSN